MFIIHEKSSSISKNVRISRVFCDVDGILANFAKGCCEKCNVEYPSDMEFGDDWLDKACDLSWTEKGKLLVDKCNGYSFWFNLDLFPWGKELHDLVVNSGKEWYYLTKPTNDAMCYAGKHDWIQKYFKDATKKLIIANSDKGVFCRGKEDLLIDDKTKNLDSWRKAGGTVYHWPEIGHNYPKELVDGRLDDIKKLIA